MRTDIRLVYIALDGREFPTAETCARYEQDCMEVDAMLSTLEAPPTTSDGSTYRQQAPGTRKRLMDWCHAHKEHCHRDAEPPWSDAMQRLWCMDNRDREWGQPYFATNPNPQARPD
jgi:hypothetical protein